MDYSIKPEEHELREAREVVEGALETCKAVLPKDEDIKVSLGWDEDSFMEKVKGATGRCHSPSEIEIFFNAGVSEWKPSLESTVSHEYAHAWFHEKRGSEAKDIQFVWQQVLMDAHAKLIAERTTENKEEISKAVTEEYIRKNWKEIKKELSSEIGESEDLFYGQDAFKMWTGYTVAYFIGQKLLEDHELEDFPGLKRSDVLEAGDALFE